MIGFCVFVIFAVCAVWFGWWTIKHFGGEPMSADERAVPTAPGRPHSVTEGGVGYGQPYGRMG